MKKILLLLFIVSSLQVFSQDIEKLISKKPIDYIKGKGLEVKGGIDANTRFYTPFGLDNRLPTFQYIFSGKLQFDIFEKIKMPVSFSYSNEKANLISSFGRNLPNLPYSQPFNRISLKPSYKGHKLFLGTNMMNFSSYSLSNYRFEGVGYEYKTSKFPIYGGAMVGTFKKPVPIIKEITSALNKPAYKRKGFAAKLGYQKKQDFVEISILNSFDLKQSVETPLDSLNIFPQDNTAISTKFQKMFLKKLIFSGEIGRSIITNTRNIEFKSSLNNRLSEAFNFGSSNIAKTAIKTGIDYKTKKNSYGFEYSNVAPNYSTFGAYFFNDDLETFALRASNQKEDGSLVINSSIGLQQNTSKSLKPQDTQRWVGALEVNYMPTEKINMALSYSNFSDFTNLQSNYLYLTAIDPFAQLDTLNYRQINQSIGSNMNFALPDKGKTKRSITTAINYQAGNAEQGRAIEKNAVFTSNIGYAIQNDAKKLGINYGINILVNSNQNGQDLMYGPILNFNKSFLKDKLKTTTSLIYNFNTTQNKENRVNQIKRVALGNVGMQWQINKQHTLGFTTIFLDNNNVTDRKKVGENFTEITFNLNYKYNFKGLSLKF